MLYFFIAPSSPDHISVEAISSTEAIIQWMPSKTVNSDTLWYQVHWQTENVGVKNRKEQIVPSTSATYDNEIAYITRNLTNLLPNQLYSVWVRACTSNETFSESRVVKMQTFPEPDNITVLTVTATTIEFEWHPTKNITRFIIQFTSVINKNISIAFDSESRDEQSPQFRYTIENLQPKSLYKFSILIYYPRGESPYVWPPDGRFIYETLADCPTAPGKPVVKHLSGEVYQVVWDPSKDNGASIEEYSLEAKNQSIEGGITSTNNSRVARSTNVLNATINGLMIIDEPEPNQLQWIVYYNGSESWWIIRDLHPINNFLFRVRARNELGWSVYSIESEPISPALEQYSPAEKDSIIYKSLIGLSAGLLVIPCLIIYCTFFLN